MTRIGLLVNPAAGRGRARRVGPIALDLLSSAGHDVVDLTAPDATSARQRAAAFLADPEAGALVGVGGDGVANLAVNAVLTHAPHVPISLVPAGTGNDTARSLHLPLGDPVAAIAHLVAALTREPRVIDVGEITMLDPDRLEEPAPDGELQPAVRRYFVNVAGAGIDAAVNARANRISWPKGSARYVVALAIELASFRGFDVQVIADGQDVGGAGTLLAVANSRYIGGGMRIAPDASWNDGLFDVVTAPTVPRRTLAVVFPRVYRGTHVAHPVVSVRHAREVLLLPGPGTSRRLAPPPLLHADGEPVGAMPLRLRVVPEALRVLA